MEKKVNDAMPLCMSCWRQPSQIPSICMVAREEGITPEAFVMKYAEDIGMNTQNRFLCSDCKEKMQEFQSDR